MMVRKGCLGTSSLGVNIRGTTYLRELGGHALCGEGSEWLGSMPRPHTKEVWTEKIRPVVQQGFELFWKDTPLQSENDVTCYPLFREGAANVAGKVLSRH
jgi:hypothetical protein